MERGEFSLNYQPQLDLVSGEISGMEALIRWENPELGVLAPQDFIPVAEDTGLIVPIGDWVLRHACAQAKAWRDAGVPLQRIAVNVSAIQFRQPDFPKRVGQALEQVGLEPAVLEIELTEGVLINDLDNAIKRLGQLKALNIQIAIDDFGTGYSSMSYLKHLPIDRLKIDRSFIRHINTNANDRAIATAIIAMAENMNLRVTAEGVEEEGQLTFMETLRCDEVQGCYISRPLSAEAAEPYLRGTGEAYRFSQSLTT
jgi:EAL domain-containing protein (putative c-di-GMP-specific phosphodiesterase class I)